MSINATQALQLATLLAQTAQQFHGSNTNAGRLSQSLAASAQAGIQAEAIKKAKKEQEKKNKSGGLGSIGGLFGTAAGVALAPVTGGASLALAGGIGGALGSVAGQAIGGGGVDPMAALYSGAQGAMTGYDYGKSMLPEAPSVAKAPALPGDPIVPAVNNAFEYPGTMVGARRMFNYPETSVGRQMPIQAIPSPQKVGSTVTPARPRFGQKVGGVLNYMMGGYSQAYIHKTKDGQPDELYPGGQY